MISNRLQLILLLFKRTSINNLSKTIRNSLGSIFIFVILFTFCIFLPVYEHNNIAAFKYAEYDLIFDGVNINNEKEINDIKEIEKYVNSIIFSSVRFESKYSSLKTDLEFILGTMKDVSITNFSDKLIIKKNKNLFNDDDTNSIVLDITTSKRLNVDIGDTVYVFFGPEKEKIDFKVAAIYEPMGNDNSHILALWKGKPREIYENNFGKLTEYSKTYIKCRNLEVTKKQLAELKNKSNGIGLIDRVLQLSYKKLDLEYTPPIIILTSSLGFIVLLIYFLREENKKLIVLNKNFAILNSLGFTKLDLSGYFLIEILMVQIPTLLVAIILVKYIIYDKLITNMFLPYYLLLKFSIYALFIQILAVVLSVIIIYIKLKKTNLVTMLSKE